MTDASSLALARELARLRERLTALERKSQISNSTVQGPDGEALSVVSGIRAGIAAGAAAADALTRATEAKAKADGAVVTFFGDTEPGYGVKFGDFWRQSDGTVKQYDGEDWQDITDPSLASDVASALDGLAATNAALDGKVTTYYANTTNPPQSVSVECIPNGDFEDDDPTTQWANTVSGSVLVTTDAAKDGHYGMRLTASTSGNVFPAARAGVPYLPTAQNHKYRVDMDVRLASGTAAVGDAGIAGRITRTGNTATSAAYAATDGPTSTADGWMHVTYDLTVSTANADTIQFGPWVRKTSTDAVFDFDNVHISDLSVDTSELQEGDLWVVTDLDNLIRRWNGTRWVDLKVGTDALADFAVTASKLEADLVLASRVIAGDPVGKRSEMNPDGFHVYASDGTGGIREVARLGVEGESDYFAVANAAGTSTATISENGVMTGAQINTDSVFYQGMDLSATLDALPRGIVARGVRTTNCAYIEQGSNGYIRPYLRVDATLQPGRRYRIYTTPMMIVTNSIATVQLRAAAGAAALTSSEVIAKASAKQDWTTTDITATYELPSVFTSATTGSFLLTYTGDANKYAGIYPSGHGPIELVVEDIGPTVDDTGLNNLNSVNDNPALQNPTVLRVPVQYLIRWNGDARSASTSDFVIGGAPDVPERRVMAIFPNITGVLSGHTIDKVRVRVTIEQWQVDNGTGMVALAYHGYANPSDTPTGALPSHSQLYAMTIPAPSSRWLDITQTYAQGGWTTGSIRGVILERPSTLNSRTDYLGRITQLPGPIAPGYELFLNEDNAPILLEITYH